MKLAILSLISLLAPSAAPAAITAYADIPYRGRADSPFYADIHTGRVLVQAFDGFEEYAVSTPGLRLMNGNYVTGTGSVDEDDGKLDNIGRGLAWGGGGGGHYPSPWKYEIRFDKDASGNYPGEAGLVFLSYPGGGFYFMQAYDAFGDLLTLEPISAAAPGKFPSGFPAYYTGGDRFYGLSTDKGISRILVGGSILAFDHVQFGYPVPEPSIALLAAGAGAGLAARRRGGKHGWTP